MAYISANMDSAQTALSLQSILASQSSQDFIQSDEDIFHCGRCKLQFTNLLLFLSHKQSNCYATKSNVICTDGQTIGLRLSEAEPTTANQNTAFRTKLMHNLQKQVDSYGNVSLSSVATSRGSFAVDDVITMETDDENVVKSSKHNMDSTFYLLSDTESLARFEYQSLPPPTSLYPTMIPSSVSTYSSLLSCLSYNGGFTAGSSDPQVQFQTVDEAAEHGAGGERSDIQNIRVFDLQNIGQIDLQNIRHMGLQNIRQVDLQNFRQVDLQNIRQLDLQSVTHFDLQNIRQVELQNLTQVDLQNISQLDLQNVSQLDLQSIRQLCVPNTLQVGFENVDSQHSQGQVVNVSRIDLQPILTTCRYPRDYNRVSHQPVIATALSMGAESCLSDSSAAVYISDVDQQKDDMVPPIHGTTNITDADDDKTKNAPPDSHPETVDMCDTVNARLHRVGKINRALNGSHAATIYQSALTTDCTPAHSTSRGKYKCQYCEKKFSKNFDLQQHQRSHTGEKPFHCIVCGRGFAQKSNVKKHMQTHKVWPQGNGRTLPAQPICERLLDQVGITGDDQIDQVSSQDIGGVTYLKTNCKAPSQLVHTKISFISDGDGEDGVERVNVVVDNSYICQYCSVKCNTYIQLKSHMIIHKDEQVYKCALNNCQESFRELDAFLEHTKVHKNEMSYRCHICCEGVFTSLHELSAHQSTHALNQTAADGGAKLGGPIYYSCVKCNSRYATPTALQHHMETTSHSFPCPSCAKVFFCERYLRRHLPIHGTVGDYKCHVCEKCFKTEHYLKIHLVIHSGVKPFKCTQCLNSFNRRDKLTRHLLIHDNIKRYKCPFRSYSGCTKEFNRPDKLKAHIVSHSGAKPHRCRQCGKSFTRRPHLREHESAMHSRDFRFRCAVCGRGYLRLKLYKQHRCVSARKVSEEDGLDTTVVDDLPPPTSTTSGEAMKDGTQRGLIHRSIGRSAKRKIIIIKKSTPPIQRPPPVDVFDSKEALVFSNSTSQDLLEGGGGAKEEGVSVMDLKEDTTCGQMEEKEKYHYSDDCVEPPARILLSHLLYALSTGAASLGPVHALDHSILQTERAVDTTTYVVPTPGDVDTDSMEALVPPGGMLTMERTVDGLVYIIHAIGAGARLELNDGGGGFETITIESTSCPGSGGDVKNEEEEEEEEEDQVRTD